MVPRLRESRLLAPSGHGGVFTQPRVHLIDQLCKYLIPSGQRQPREIHASSYLQRYIRVQGSAKKVGPRLRELPLAARESQEAGITQPRVRLLAHHCAEQLS